MLGANGLNYRVSATANVAAGCAPFFAQPAAIPLCLSCVRLSSPHCVATNAHAFSRLLVPAVRVRTLKRSIRFLSSKRLLSPASVSATPLAFRNVPFLAHAALASARGSSNGLPWAAPTSRQRGVLSTIQSPSPAAAILLRAFLRARDASLRAQIRSPVSTVIFLLLYRVLLFRFPVRALSFPFFAEPGASIRTSSRTYPHYTLRASRQIAVRMNHSFCRKNWRARLQARPRCSIW